MKMLVCFVIRFAILFVLMAWPWPGLRNLIGAGFREQTRLLAGVVLPPQSFRVETISFPRHPTVDTVMLLADRNASGTPGGPSGVEIPFDSASQGWIPFVMWIALCVATPLPWFKRWRVLLIGVLAVEALVAATILVSVSHALTGGCSTAWPRLPLMLANRLLVENIWFSFIPPFVLWAGWLAWGGHWEQLCDKGATRSAARQTK